MLCPAERGIDMKRATLLTAAGLLLSGVLAVTAVPVYAAETGTAQETVSETTEAAAEGSTAITQTETTTVKIGYEHDPMENPKAAQDIIVNHDAVYGYSPSPLSTRLKEFVDIIDWTNDAEVAEARDKRIEYYATEEILYEMIDEMIDQNKTIEEIARAVSQKRNELRLEAYIGDPDGLARVKKSNLDTYGDENGPSIDFLYKKYGSWEAILQKALSSNPGMDACLGLYDDYYGFYNIEEKVQLKISEDAVKTDETTGEKLYTVKEGDNLWKIAEMVYGDGTKWTVIYEENEDILPGPAELKVGMELVIPEAVKGAKSADTASTAAAAETQAADAAKAQ